MQRVVEFQARGHENIRGTHRTTIEITREDSLTTRGDCIIGVGATLALSDLSEEVRALARDPETMITLSLRVDEMTENIVGHGSEGLVYTDPTCMVARKSSYTCGRTLMVGADRAAVDLERDFIAALRDPNTILSCRILFNQ